MKEITLDPDQSAVGRDAEIIVRLANEQIDKLPAMALELVKQNVQAIYAVSPPAVRAARETSHSRGCTRGAAVSLGVAMEMFEVSSPSDFEPVVQAAARSKSAGVVMLSAPLFGGNPQLLADLALQNRLPAINIFPDFAQKGGLMGYGPELQN